MRAPKPFPGRSITTSAFWKAFGRLSKKNQQQARAAHRAWLANPRQAGLRFKKVHSRRQIYSVRVNIDVRVVGILAGDDMIWYWIGSHDEYEALLKRF